MDGILYACVFHRYIHSISDRFWIGFGVPCKINMTGKDGDIGTNHVVFT